MPKNLAREFKKFLWQKCLVFKFLNPTAWNLKNDDFMKVWNDPVIAIDFSQGYGHNKPTLKYFKLSRGLSVEGYK